VRAIRVALAPHPAAVSAFALRLIDQTPEHQLEYVYTEETVWIMPVVCL
jgi:hypothetical protein